MADTRGWQPIETAPKTPDPADRLGRGSLIELFIPSGGGIFENGDDFVIAARWDRHHWEARYTEAFGTSSVAGEPTHWRWISRPAATSTRTD